MKTILYKRDLNGDVIQWTVAITQDTNDLYQVVTTYGKLDGKQIENIFEITDAYTHAEFLKNSVILRKKRLGYKSLEDVIALDNDHWGSADRAIITAEISKIGVNQYIKDYLPKYNTTVDNLTKPMKCQKFNVKLFKNGMIGQPKVNGVRATIQWIENNGTDLFDTTSVHILSKEGLRYRIKHIEDWFERYMFLNEDNKELIFDGELYIHNERVTTIGGAARNCKNAVHPKLQFVCFDLAIPDVIQSDRIAILEQLFDNSSQSVNVGSYHKGYYNYNENVYSGIYGMGTYYPLYDKSAYLLYSKKIISAEAAIHYCDYMISNGFEGAVFRDPNATYCFGQRPKTMLKLKRFNDAEFKIVNIDIQQSLKSDIGVSLLYTLENDIDPQTFICSGEGTASEKRAIFANRDNYIGKMATVKFYERTINNLPFHANVIAIRDYEK